MQNKIPQFGQALPLGTKLGDYIIEEVLGRGGFGITYCALDTKLNRKVVIKESFPRRVSLRDATNVNVCPSHPDEEGLAEYQKTLKKFLDEARTVAALDHPGIVRVLEFREANGTAYFVMPFVEGRSFAQVIKSTQAAGGHFSQEEIIELLKKILRSLKYLHGRQVFHRDIKPDNILITESFDPILIDLGGASSAKSEESITVIESAGYTPLEQLNRKGKIGAWTDLYALGAAFSLAISGKKIPNAVERVGDDPWVPLADIDRVRPHYSSWLLRSIDKAVEMNVSARHQSATEWLDLIDKEQDQQSKELDSGRVLASEMADLDLCDATEQHECGEQESISESRASHPERKLEVDGETDSSCRYSSSENAKTASLPLREEILRWVFLLPGVFLGSGIVHYLAKILNFFSSRASGNDTWGDLIIHSIFASLAYGASGVYCAYIIAPRAKNIVAIVFAVLIFIPSVYCLVVDMKQSQWIMVLEMIFINVGSIWVAVIARNGELE
jgi:serine/threonine protein kinase